MNDRAARFRHHAVPPVDAVASWPRALRRAVEQRRRAGLAAGAAGRAYRAFSGAADGVEGVFLDVYGEGAVLMVYEGAAPAGFAASPAEAAVALEVLRPAGVRAVYVKPFARDRSRLGGALPPVVTDSKPAAGESLPEALLVREDRWSLEVRLYDGLSTGLFLDQRANRRWAAEWVARRARANAAGRTPAVLNTFAYTCAFSVAAATGGAATTSVDVSARYLEWGKRNFAHNGLEPAGHRWARMDTFEFFQYARRKQLRYDLVILDPPSFGSGNKRRGIRPWSAVEGYGRLVHEAATLLVPGGAILASTNTAELCRPGRLRGEIVRALGGEPTWLALPPPPPDFAGESGRFAALAFTPAIRGGDAGPNPKPSRPPRQARPHRRARG